MIGRLYVEKRFSQSKLAAAEKLTNDIQKAFNETLSETKWFTAVARSRVLEKLNRLQKNVGYPDWILNDTRLNDYYREFKIRSNSSYFRNVLKFRRADVGPLNDLARKNTFVLPVATVRNAAYSPGKADTTAMNLSRNVKFFRVQFYHNTSRPVRVSLLRSGLSRLV